MILLKKIQLLLFFTIFSLYHTISNFQPLELQFDYTNIQLSKFPKIKIENALNITSNYLNSLIQVENHHFKDYFFDELSLSDTINCEISNFQNVKYKNKNLKPSLSLLILPITKINEKIKSDFEINNYICLKDGKITSRVLIIMIEYKSEKKFNELLDKDEFIYYLKWKTIRFIFSSIGFNEKELHKKFIYNNLPYLRKSKKKSLYLSYKKFMSLSTNKTSNKKKLNKNNNQNKNQKNQIDFWPKLNNYFNDIMSNDDFSYNNKNNLLKTTISEITLNLFNDIPYYLISPCDLLYHENKCNRFDNKCFNFSLYQTDYFMEYSFSNNKNNSDLICYLNTKNNILNNQCGINYGHILSPKPISNEIKKNKIWKYTINANQTQKILLLTPSKYCPNKHPRTVYFLNNESLSNPYEYFFNNKIDEITLKDPKYFIIMSKPIAKDNPKSTISVLNNVLVGKTRKDNYNYIWDIDNRSPFEYNKNIHLTKYQKISRFPDGNTFKDGINIFYNKLKSKFPNDFTYIPETYLWSKQKDIILNKFKNYKYTPENPWIFKPTRSYGAHGVHILKDYQEIENQKNKNFLLSRYVLSMLINNKKFDFRGFVVVTGMSPLKIYYYKDGYMRLTSRNFSMDEKDINDTSIHITTTAVNSLNTGGYIYEKHLFDEEASFWNYLTFERYCRKIGVNYTDIREQTKDMIIKSFISLNSDFLKIIKNKKLNEENLFQLYGFDIMVSNEYKVYLLEINRFPTMAAGHISATFMYEHLVSDILNVVGIVPFAHDETQEPLDKNDIYFYENKTEEIVDDALCEFSRPRGGLELIFPLKNNINKYKKYFEEVTSENQLLWNKLMNSSGEYD